MPADQLHTIQGSAKKIAEMDIHKNITLARKKKGLTQEQLAELANVTVRTIQRVESGENVPRAFTVKTIAEALGTSFEELTNGSQDDHSSKANYTPDVEKERHFLQLFCLSCFGYLVIPFVHFLVPVYVLKRWGSSHPTTIAFGRSVIRQQIYWVVVLNFLMILTLAYNFIVPVYFNGSYFLNYLWVFFAMYLLNAFIIVLNLRRVKRAEFSMTAAA